MPRFLSLSAVAIAFLGAGCSLPKEPSPFVRDGNIPDGFNAVAARVGVSLTAFSFGSTTNTRDGKSHRDVGASYCARPEQIDEMMRLLHAEFVRRLRESGAEPQGESPPAGAAVREWTISYSAGIQQGTIRVTRTDGAAGQCREEGRLEYQVNFVLDEEPKKAP